MKYAIIIRGPAGTGKSVVASHLRMHYPKLVHIDIDVFKYMIAAETSPLRTSLAHDVARHFITKLVEHDMDMVIEEILREEHYHQILDLLKEYEVIKIFLTASSDTLVQRDSSRPKKKGEEVIERLYEKIKPFGDELVIDTTHHSIDQVTNIILKTLHERGF